MMAVAGGLAPIFLLIIAGWAARASGVVPRAEWGGINKLAYWVFFPSLLFTTIARADFGAIAAGPFLGAAVCGFFAMGVIGLALRWPLKSLPGPTYSSVFQGAIRWNGIVLLAAAEPVFGPVGAALAALVFLPVVPLVNAMGVGALTIWGAGANPSLRRFFGRLFTNPLILACAAGGVGNVTGVLNLPILGDTADLLARAALAGGLLGVGAGLDLTALRAHPGALVLAVGLKLAVMPAVMWLVSAAFGLDPLATAVLVAAGATPGAAASYVLAKELGGDAELTAGHVTATVLLSALTLPLWIAATAP